MKRVLIFFSLLIVIFSHAQTPQAMNYQAVARTATGAIIPTQIVNVRFSILDGSINGTVLYQETQQTTTNNYGLFTLAIGKGTAVTGTFSGVNWASGTDKFLKVEISPDGTTNYQLQGTTQLLSVPYALYSEKTRLIAGNAINITNGNTIAANYIAGTGININGATISGAYVGGNAININGNTISANYTAGTGISINGNMISSTVNTYWLPHANGIYYNAGKVGIGITPDATIPLTVFLPNTGVGNAVLHLKSNDTWHSALSIFNGDPTAVVPVQKEYSFILAGPSNGNAIPGSFGLFNHQTSTWGFILNPTTNDMAIGSLSAFNSNPAKSRLHVFGGDVNIDQIGSGIIMKSPNGQCWRITIDNSGNLVRTAIACP